MVVIPPGGRPPVDVQLTGTVYLDIIFSGIAGPPPPGRELRSTGLGSSPGGIANLAVAMRRLGLSVRLDAAFATDVYGDYLWRMLEDEEGVDLSGSVRFSDWATPVTVSLVYAADRGMITHECPDPGHVPSFLDRDLPPARSLFAHLGADAPTILQRARDRGLRIFADVGWDESERWADEDLDGLAYVDAFLPNCVEAMAYTRASTPEAAAERLARRVPTVVVKCGADGAIARRQAEAEAIHEPAIAVDAIDPTGAGDVFDAGFVFGTLAGWPLRHVLRFANLCAGLSVRHFGGSLSAPTWGEVAEWISTSPEQEDRYGFLHPYIDRAGQPVAPRRARPTI